MTLLEITVDLKEVAKELKLIREALERISLPPSAYEGEPIVEGDFTNVSEVSPRPWPGGEAWEEYDPKRSE